VKVYFKYPKKIKIISKKIKSDHKSWFWLGIIFLFLAFDEAASVHEILVGILKNIFTFSGYFYYAWIVPYGMGLVVLAGIYVPFFKDLPKKSMKC
jgi:hypothetical protein